MRAGSLRHKIVIQQRTTTQDSAGQPVETWTTFSTVWAAINTKAGKEYFSSNQVQSEQNYVFEIRSLSGVKPYMRIYFDSRYFDITAIANESERDRRMYLNCKENLNG